MSPASGGAFYKDYPQTCDPEDYWAQVGRTVNGKSVPQEQIDLIITAVRAGLEFADDDLLLDLCCGNGALTTHFFRLCRGGLGVDFSAFLIDVANQRFSHRPSEGYLLDDVIDYVRNADAGQAAGFTKALCYGAFQCLDHGPAAELLSLLRRRFSGLKRLFIGNLPDKGRLAEFYRDRPYTPGIEDRADTPIGIWRTADEFRTLAASTGWQCQISLMPPAFYGAHYRYDALLVPV